MRIVSESAPIVCHIVLPMQGCAFQDGSTRSTEHMLRAVARGAAAGAEGLRELDIGGNDVPVETAAEVAALLRQLTSLEALNLPSVFDKPRGLRELVAAVESLPLLRRQCVLDVRNAAGSP